MNLHLTRYGQGIPLVLLHGWGFDSHIWLPLVPLLQDSYELILVDLPGFGLSQLMEWPEFKQELLKRLPDRFALAGWSMGGLYATRLALEEPKRVQHLLNIASSPRFISDLIWPGVPKDVFSAFHQNLSSNVHNTLEEFVALQSNNLANDFVLGHPPSQEGLNMGLSILESWDLREGLRDLAVPTCFFFGRLDPITPARTMNAMKWMYPDFKYVLFHRSAHMPFLSHTQDFITEISGFIQ